MKNKKQKINNNILNVRIIFTLLTILAFSFLNDDKITMMLNDYRVLADCFFFFLLAVSFWLWGFFD